jgi:hypothetical protein
MASNAKTVDGEQKSPVQTLMSHNLAQFSTILHNLHNFRTILLNRQWAVLFERNQIQAHKRSFSILCTKAKQIVYTKNPLPNPLNFFHFPTNNLHLSFEDEFFAQNGSFPHLTEAESLRTKRGQKVLEAELTRLTLAF